MAESEKGKLLFKSPQCPKERRIVISFFYLITIFSFIGLSIYSLYFSLISGDIRPAGFFFIFLFLGFFAGILMPGNLYPHFHIYEKGITRMAYHTLHPWSDCDKIVTYLDKQSKINGDFDKKFIKWNNIACYEIWPLDTNLPLTKRRAPNVVIHLKEIKKSQFFLFGFEDAFQSKETKAKWRKTMNVLIYELKQRKIPRIPWFCPKCQRNPEYPQQNCPHCGFKRY